MAESGSGRDGANRGVPAVGPEAGDGIVPPRAAQGFLGASEREFTRRDFLARSSVAGLVVAAGGVFLAGGRAEAMVGPSRQPSDLPTAERPAVPAAGNPSAVRVQAPGARQRLQVAQHCSHGSHGSHGSHASHASHGSHASW